MNIELQQKLNLAVQAQKEWRGGDRADHSADSQIPLCSQRAHKQDLHVPHTLR